MPDKCVVFNCKSGYDSDRRYRAENNLPQLSQFRPKKGMLEAWEKRISRGAGWKMKLTDTVCELHFEEKFIKTTHLEDLFCGTINLSHQRKKKALSDDAIPTIFNGYPSYKTNYKATKRKSPQERKSVTKRPRKNVEDISDDMVTEEIPQQVANDNVTEQQIDEEPESILLSVPTFYETICQEAHKVQKPKDWYTHRGPGFITFVHIENAGIQIDRYVKFSDNGIMKISMLQKDIDLKDVEVHTVEDISKLLTRVGGLECCPGTGIEEGRSHKCHIFLEATGVRKRRPPRCKECAEKKKSVTKGIRRSMNQKVKRAKKQRGKNNQIRILKKKVITRNKRILTLKRQVEALLEKCANLETEQVENYIKDMPPCWKHAILACVNAAKAKSSNGRRFTTDWVYECQLLRIKSLSLYKKMLRDNFLPLPSIRTLQRYMRKLSPAYGFQENIFAMLKEKSGLMKESEKHGSLLIDEVKLSEGLWFDKHSLKLLGFVHLDQFTPESQKDVPADHALVMMFQGFQGQYFQSISAHLSRGAVKGTELSKLTLEAIRLVEAAGFFVDAVVADAAPWNRNMWAQYGIKKLRYEKENSRKKFTVDDDDNDEDYEDNFEYDVVHAGTEATSQKQKKKKKRKTYRRKKRDDSPEDIPADGSVASCVHPVDSSRRLWFVSDFPHLVKSMKQRIINAEELMTPDGPVKLKHWLIVVQEDEKRGIKVAPKLSKEHFLTESYAAMSVGKAISFFGEQAATGMEHYKRLGIKGMEDCESTVKFIRRINVLIEAMNSNTRSEGLKAPENTEEVFTDPPVCVQCNKTHAENTPQRKRPAREVLEDFLAYLEKWETSGVPRDKRLTASAAYGLRITINTALELSLYLINDLGYEYFMTRRINQNKLEHFFGEIRQGCGAHSHPDPAQFIQIYRLMCFKTLVKPPRGSNVTGGDMLKSLLQLPDHRSLENKKRQLALEKELDEALDTGEEVQGIFSDHTYYQSLTVDKSAMKMFGGYVARKARRASHAKECEECFQCLKAPEDQPLQEDDDIIHSRSKGFLITPSNELMTILEKIEISVLEVFQSTHLHTDIIFEVAEQVKQKSFEELGCWFHRRKMTKDIISFYMTTRLIFACEEYNRRLSENAKKKQKAKQQQKIFRLTC